MLSVLKPKKKKETTSPVVQTSAGKKLKLCRTRLVEEKQKSADLARMLAEYQKNASLQDPTLSTHYIMYWEMDAASTTAIAEPMTPL